MPIEIVQGNLLDAFDRGDVTVIGHCVNCQGVMGSGIALSIKQRYPEVYNEYKRYYDNHISRKLNKYLLGSAQSVPLSVNKTVFNLFGQNDYGKIVSRYVNYGAIGAALESMSNVGITVGENAIVGFPFKIASDRAGGDWGIILEMIEYYFQEHNVKIYKLGN